MLQILYKYLLLTKKASVPGLGVFHIHRRPASLDFSNKAFTAPLTEVTFTRGVDVSDNKFYTFLSKEQQIGEAEAEQVFGDFVNTLKNNLDANGSVELPRFGLLTKDAAGSLQFQPFRKPVSLFSPVSVERTVREVSQTGISGSQPNRKGEESPALESEDGRSRRKDYWWVLAIILAAVAIAAIIFYYRQNGSFR